MKMGPQEIGDPVSAEIAEKIEGWAATIINSGGERFTCPLRVRKALAQEDADRYAQGKPVLSIPLRETNNKILLAAE